MFSLEVKDKAGRPCVIEVEGPLDDPQVMSGTYLDVIDNDEVSEEQLEYITDAYSNEICAAKMENFWSR